MFRIMRRKARARYAAGLHDGYNGQYATSESWDYVSGYLEGMRNHFIAGA